MTQKDTTLPDAPDQSAIARALLEAMEAMGKRHAALLARQDFEDRDWAVTAVDVARLLAELKHPVPPGSSSAKSTSLSSLGLPFSGPLQSAAARDADDADEAPPEFVRNYRPFVEAVANWRELLPAVNRLLLARSWDAIRNAAVEVFCGVLGFDDSPVSLTRRLRSKSTIEDFEQIGSFAGFRVCLVRLTRSLSDTKWSNTSEHYRPCFRVVPRALILSYEPGAGAIRLVFRQRHGQSDTRPRYRCIVGPWFLRDSQENLLTICRRLDLCSPELEDDGESLGRRVQAALECEVGALAEPWTSLPVGVQGELPGLPMADATNRLMSAFLGDWEWCWGLNAHLSNLFPLPIRYGQLWLDLDRLDRVGEPASVDDCWKRARTRTQRMTLRLMTRSWDTLEVMERFQIDVSLVVPDARGWFWVEGRPYRHMPRVGSNGRLLSRTTMPLWVDQLDEDDVDASDAATDEDSRYPLSAAEGAAVDALLGRGLERRLWMLMRYLRRKGQKVRGSFSAGQIRAWILSSVPPGEPLPLLTPTVVRTLLTPIDLSRPQRDLTNVVSDPGQGLTGLPAWACPDVSGDLAPGRWSVVAGARVHPTGALAIPASDEAGQEVRLIATGVSAFDVNPRLGATAAGERHWWIHPCLATHAALNAGELESPEEIAASGRTIKIRAVASTDIRTPQLAPWCRPRGPVLRATLDIPRVPGVKHRPTLLVNSGKLVAAGEPWLRVSRQHLAQDFDDSDSALGLVFPHGFDELVTGGMVERLPWATRGQVMSVGLEEVLRLGVQVGWRGWIEVSPHTEDWRVVDQHGRLLTIDRDWLPEDLPYSLDGEGFDAGLPGGIGPCLSFSGIDGEPVEVNVIEGVTAVPQVPRAREQAALGAVDRLPRPGVRSLGERWTRTRLRWIADGVPASLAPSLDAGQLNWRILLWCAGLVDPPSEVPEQPVREVPISSRPHQVKAVLSHTDWETRCHCGELAGSSLLGALCSTCQSPARLVEQVAALRTVELPGPVLHPWAKEVAAGLLGLVPDELATLIVRHGATKVISACRTASATPGHNARMRLSLSKDHPRHLAGQARRGLGQVVELVEAAEDSSGLVSSLVIDSVGLPTLDLVKAGNTLDEIDPTGSRLLAAFARLHGACWILKEAQRMLIAPLITTAEVHLQHCVDTVFGDVDSTTTDTLAGLLRTVSRWSRGPQPPVGAATGVARAQPESPAWWAQRAARAQLVDRYAMDLVALVGSLPTYTDSQQQEAASAVAADLLDPRRDPRGLLHLVQTSRDLPTPLPNSWSAAQAALADRLGSALGDVALAAVSTLFGGWWMGEPSDLHPTGAVWRSREEPGPAGFRRRVPPLGHVLWRSWPALRAARPELAWAPFTGIRSPNLRVEVLEPIPADDEPSERVRLEVTAETPTPQRRAASPSASQGQESSRASDQTERITVGRPSPVYEIQSIELSIKQWMELS